MHLVLSDTLVKNPRRIQHSFNRILESDQVLGFPFTGTIVRPELA